jgi:hypothetical protein
MFPCPDSVTQTHLFRSLPQTDYPDSVREANVTLSLDEDHELDKEGRKMLRALTRPVPMMTPEDIAAATKGLLNMQNKFKKFDKAYAIATDHTAARNVNGSHVATDAAALDADVGMDPDVDAETDAGQTPAVDESPSAEVTPAADDTLGAHIAGAHANTGQISSAGNVPAAEHL